MPADGAFSERRIGRPATAGEIERLIRLYSQSLKYTIAIPGEHDGGLTNQALFEILAKQAGVDPAVANAIVRTGRTNRHIGQDIADLVRTFRKV